MLLEHGMCSGPLGTGLYTLWQLESVATEASQTIGFPAMSELVYFREEGSRDPTSSWKDWGGIGRIRNLSYLKCRLSHQPELLNSSCLIVIDLFWTSVLRYGDVVIKRQKL